MNLSCSSPRLFILAAASLATLAAAHVDASPPWPQHELVLPERIVASAGEGCFWLDLAGASPRSFPWVPASEREPLLPLLPPEEQAETDRTWDPDGLQQTRATAAPETTPPGDAPAHAREPDEVLAPGPATDRWLCAQLPFLFRSQTTHASILEGRARVAAERARLGHPPLERTTVLYPSGIGPTHPPDPAVHEPGPASAWTVRPFHVDDPDRWTRLGVELEFAGGAILYLNGHEIVRHNVPPVLEPDTLAHIRPTPPWVEQTANHRWQRTTLDVDPGLLRPGENQLAARLLRRSDGGMRAMYFDVSLDGYTEVGMTRSPYLQSPTASSVVVRWETNAAATGTVEVWRHPAHDHTPDADGADADTPPLLHFHAAAPAGTRHEVILHGLRPDTQYRYRVRNHWLDDRIQPRVSRTRGFLTGPGADTRAFTFIAYGDNRTRGDRHEEVARSMWRSLHAYRPRFVLHGGDMTTTGSPRDEWQEEFFLPTLPLWGHVGLYTVIGNHERNHETYYDVFSQPGNEAFFRQRIGSVELFVVNADYTMAPEDDQHQWLDAALSDSDAHWRIVALHHPPFSCVPGRKPGNRHVRRHLVPLFVHHQVDLVIGSHDHLYGRTRVIDGIQYVTTGGGGAPTYPFRVDEDNPICVRTLHHLVIDVDDDRLLVRALDTDDAEFDRFEVRHDRERFQPPAAH